MFFRIVVFCRERELAPAFEFRQALFVYFLYVLFRELAEDEPKRRLIHARDFEEHFCSFYGIAGFSASEIESAEDYGCKSSLCLALTTVESFAST